MIIDRDKVKRILVITLNNVGDVVLTTPIVNVLSATFPKSRIDVIVGPRAKEIFEKDPKIFKVIVYDKSIPILQKRRLAVKLRRLKYDLVADLRNTIFPLLIGPRYRTSTIQSFPPEIVHKKSRHLYRLKSLGIDYRDLPSYIFIPKEDGDYVNWLICAEDIKEPIVVINPGAKSHLKRWPEEYFSLVSDRLIEECNANVILVGCAEDREVVEAILKKTKNKLHNFAERTNIRQLASLLKRAKLLITNDSAPLHVACAVETKVLALFGPTDSKKYGPTGEMDIAIQKKLSCSPCEKAVCVFNYECMHSIDPDEVFETAKEMIEGYEM